MLTSAAFQEMIHSSSNKGISSIRARLPELNGQSPAEYLANCNLLGYDSGDGEISGSLARYDGENLTVQPLSFSKTSMVSHIPNILAFDEHGKAFTVNEAQLGTSKRIYYNFKRCPGEAASAVYPYENEDKTYEDLMAHSFACSIKKLVDCNTVFDPTKPTVIMVGRPSSKGWEAADQTYIEILSRYLSLYLPEYAENITVLVLSESLAAMAGALEMNPEHWKDIFAQILDLGSSTFDQTTITPDGIPESGEESFQFGGNQLDHAIAAYADALFYKKYPREVGYSMAPDHTKIASMRFKKELCYGDNGNNLEIQQGQNTYTYSVYQNGEPVIDEATEDEETYGFRITKKSLEKILTNENGLEELHCTTVHLSDDGADEEVTHSGWLQACEYVLQQFYDKTKDLLPDNENVKKQLILTGGVSNMPEVRALAEKIFHADKAIVADNPSQTVSRGLALMLGYQIQGMRNIVEEYSCSGFTFLLDDTGLLTVEGEGDMPSIKDTDFWNTVSGNITSVQIGYGVTGIPRYAFIKCKHLKKIDIPETVFEIGELAFADCTDLLSIQIPDGVKKISDRVFYRCSSLLEVHLPNSVTEIGYASFYECRSLTSIELPDGVTEIGYAAFSDCSNLSSVSIPNSVRQIDRFSFCNCSSLSSLKLPDGITVITSGMFSGCNKLSEIKLPDSITEIEKIAFSNCTELHSIYIPDGVTKIGNSAFSGCTELYSVHISENITSIAGGLFEGCSRLKTVLLPEGTTEIGASAFLNCRALEEVHLPDSVFDIGEKAFAGCESLQSITIPKHVSRIRRFTFSSCIGLKKAVLHKEITVIDTGAFSFCKSLSEIEFPEGIISVGEYAFSNCGLVKLTLPKSIMQIGNNAFAECSLLSAVTIRCAAIGDWAFTDCGRLSEINLSDDVHSIGVSAFHNCVALNRIRLPKSLTHLGKFAFWGCDALSHIWVPYELVYGGSLRIRDVIPNRTIVYHYSEN